MNNMIVKIISILFLFISTSLSAIAGNIYKVDSDNSSVNFSVTKKQYIIEPAIFEDVADSISSKGAVKIRIDMNSVNSSNPIRDKRLVDMFFQAEFFPEAIITATINSKILNGKNSLQNAKIPATLEFFDIKKDITLEILIVKVSNNVVVSSLKPIIVNAKEFNVPTESLNALSKVCGGITISDIVPVNFV